ncbi:histidine kinase N-terminal 7TM domain-containing protein [Eubacteriaceae bacterium ES2]|nr:histidine kinase N-terminal 7TM domain-containing protein [Eubacteriaceae bacterium ES2]
MLKFISLYFFICVILLSLLFVSSFVRGKTSYAKILGWLSIATQVYILGYLMEINVESLETMLFWNQVQYFGIPFIPAFWLLVCLLYTDQGEGVRGIRLGLIFLVPVLTFFMRLTNNWHHLFYQTIVLEKSILGFSGLKLGKGPFYYIQVIYMIAALLISIGIATLNPEIRSFEDLIRLADKALYKAKGQGRNRTVVEKRNIDA